jgi:hypothetical protein
MKIILLTFMLPMSLYAQRNASYGDLISKETFNASTLSIGSLQQSMLSQSSQLQSLNGNYWRLRDVSALSGNQTWENYYWAV